jgi:hypothetical protein
MKRSISIILISIGITILTGRCSSFFEEDLNHYRIKILAPADSLYTSGQDITFWWNYVNGATKYEFQLVYPQFDAVTRLIKDTVITGNSIISDLEPGTYQWRVRGLNETSSTCFSVHTLFVVEPLSYQGAILK